MDRNWNREFGNGREGEVKVCCTDCFGGLGGSPGKTVLLADGCGVVCCDNVI